MPLLAPSVDAVYQAFKASDDTFFRHAAGNTAVTDGPSNRYKGQSPPAWLHETTRFVLGQSGKREFISFCNRALKVRQRDHNQTRYAELEAMLHTMLEPEESSHCLLAWPQAVR